MKTLGIWGALALVLVSSVGCASSATLRFDCPARGQVNDGLLLTIDLVQITEAEEREIRDTGDQWFYSDLRRELASRTQTIAVKDGCAETVILPHRKGYEVLAIIADYQFEGDDNQKGQMLFRTKPEWRGKKLRVAVNEKRLTITQS